MASKEKPLLAYQAHDGDEGYCIVLATTGIAARRKAANEMDCDFEGVEWCRRAKSLDQYAPGPAPLKALIGIGWWWECSGCYQPVNSDTPNPVYEGQRVYCCPWCRLDALSESLVTKAEERAVKERLAAFVTERWPGTEVTGTHAYVRVKLGGAVTVEDASVDFRFPGGQYTTRYREADGRPDDNGLWVPAGDMPAWKAFAARVAPAEVAHG